MGVKDKPNNPGLTTIKNALMEVLTGSNFQESRIVTKHIDPEGRATERILYFDKSSHEFVMLQKGKGDKFRKEIYRGLLFEKAFNSFQKSRQMTIDEQLNGVKDNEYERIRAQVEALKREHDDRESQKQKADDAEAASNPGPFTTAAG